VSGIGLAGGTPTKAAEYEEVDSVSLVLLPVLEHGSCFCGFVGVHWRQLVLRVYFRQLGSF
jgi:hypothetical protein